ncbi:hypothetical protein KDX30_20805 [Pseudomonas sp. CDFA 553]|uniref:hypothetical protein n=1 Tax=Pseudomonas quasicaspiana TaxID=2829821 RepID=UPI001E4FFB85|nr:hypothetical protein [Pseudomonas quasicaspiana]MCD5990331.1 hypothetical protein [Pseudomonas quasicaspiana]
MKERKKHTAILFFCPVMLFPGADAKHSVEARLAGEVLQLVAFDSPSRAIRGQASLQHGKNAVLPMIKHVQPFSEPAARSRQRSTHFSKEV